MLNFDPRTPMADVQDMWVARIQFQDGATHRCVGTVKGGVPNETPGESVPWANRQEVVDHCAKNELVLIEVYRDGDTHAH